MPGPYVGQLGAVGLAKESVLGTFVAPTRFIPTYLPMPIGSPDINLLLSKGVRAVPDLVYKAQQGAGMLKNGKFKFEIEPENIGEVLQGTFGADSTTEQAAIVIDSTNNKIDFKENGGAQLHATIASSTYAMGTTSATNGTLCKAVKTALEAAAGAGLTYTVTYSYSTKKMTVTASSTTVQFLWLTGTNQATAAYAALGWTHADTSAAIALTSDSTATVAMQHSFTRQAVAQLPTYSLWVSNGLNYPEFVACMSNKLEFDFKAPEWATAEVDWLGSKYQGGGSSQSLSYSTLNPFKFDQVSVSVAGSPVLIYKDLKLTLDNKVKVDPVLGGSIYSNVVYTEAFDVSLAATIVVEDSTEWAKFIAGTATSFTITLTSAQYITGTTPYSMTVTLPNAYYKAAPLPLANGLIEITFQMQLVYSTSSLYTANIALVNSIQSAY